MFTRFNVWKQFDALPVTGANTYTSQRTDINQRQNIALMISFTGTMAGTLSVEVSNDGEIWTDLTFNPVLTQPTGADLTYGVNMNGLAFYFLRTKYVNTSGDGVLTSTFTSKDLS